MIDGIWMIFSGIFGGIFKIFNIVDYMSQFNSYKGGFGVIDWILAIFSFVLVVFIWGIIIYLAILGIRKYIRFRKSAVGNEDLLEEVATLHRDVLKLTKEREKLLYLKEGQYAPNHFHWFKTEDIINRGGGNVLIRVYNSLPDEEIDYVSDVTVHTDGRTYTVPAGTQIRLTPGESIHVQQYLYHDFSVEEGTGPVLLGEVSQCNDDNTDNRFNPPVGRFPTIEEDEPPYRLLCNEYPAAK